LTNWDLKTEFNKKKSFLIIKKKNMWLNIIGKVNNNTLTFVLGKREGRME